MRSVWPAFAVAVMALCHPLVSGAQTGDCVISQDEFGQMRQVIENGERIVLLQDPFTVRCPDGTELRANSGRVNPDTRDVYLLGSVFFQDSVQTLTANEATYNPDNARLWARGDVVYVDRREGSTLRGPELEYLRATEIRPLAQMTATQRPTLTMPAAEGAAEAEPLELTSDRVEMLGEDELSAFGDVVITRSDLRATGGEARYNSATEALALRAGAVVQSGEFELVGDSVDALLVEGAIDFLHSRSGAALRGEELRVSGDDLQLHFRDDLLQRVVARVHAESESRARATSTTFQVEADSLDAILVDQRLEEVYAIGDAFGESIDTTTAAPVPDEAAMAPDTSGARPDILERDWIRGDTIIGYFVAAEPTAADPDSADQELDTDPEADAVAAEGIAALERDEESARQSVELRQMVARGSAQSLYRVSAQGQSDPARRNVNFLVGRQIVLDVAEGALQVATVDGLQYGVYLEAQPEPEEQVPADEEGLEDLLDEPIAPEPEGA